MMGRGDAFTHGNSFAMGASVNNGAASPRGWRGGWQAPLWVAVSLYTLTEGVLPE